MCFIFSQMLIIIIQGRIHSYTSHARGRGWAEAVMDKVIEAFWHFGRNNELKTLKNAKKYYL